MTSPTRSLVIVRSGYQPDPDRHVTLAVRPEIAAVCGRDADDKLTPLVDWFDLHDDAAWFDLGLDALDVIGTLARLALDVTLDLIVAARDHGCDGLPMARHDDHDEIRRAKDLDGCCNVWLSCGPGTPLATDGELPYLEVTVPRNRERAWHARLSQRLAEINRGNAMTLAPLNQPAKEA